MQASSNMQVCMQARFQASRSPAEPQEVGGAELAMQGLELGSSQLVNGHTPAGIWLKPCKQPGSCKSDDKVVVVVGWEVEKRALQQVCATQWCPDGSCSLQLNVRTSHPSPIPAHTELRMWRWRRTQVTIQHTMRHCASTLIWPKHVWGRKLRSRIPAQVAHVQLCMHVLSDPAIQLVELQRCLGNTHAQHTCTIQQTSATASSM